LQASVREIVHGERTLFARTAVMFAGAVADRYQDTVTRFMGALAQSRRREAERTIRYYRTLLIVTSSPVVVYFDKLVFVLSADSAD
jgi:hypothetical protein